LTATSNLTSISQTFVFSGFENSLEEHLITSTEVPVRFMSMDYAMSEELGKDLTLALFKKNRNRMERTERIHTYIGVPLAILGDIMVAGSDALYYNCVNGDCEGNARGGFGILALAAGVGLGGTGGVLWIVGSKR